MKAEKFLCLTLLLERKQKNNRKPLVLIFMIICKSSVSPFLMHTYIRASQPLITPTLTSNFGKLLHDLLLSFALGDGPHKQTIVGNRDAHTDVFPRANFVVVTLQERLQSESKRPQVDRNKQTITYEFDGLLSSLFSAEGDEGVSSVQPAERVHHQTQIPYGSGFLEQRD